MRYIGFVSGLVILLASCEPTEQDFSDAAWQNPEIYDINTEPPHATLIPFQSVASAQTSDRMQSEYFKLLNGTWQFHWSPNPGEVPDQFYQDTFDDRPWDKISVPSNWQLSGKYDSPVHPNTTRPFKADPPRVPIDTNSVGSYRTSFEIPNHWQNHQVFLHFDGVQSAMYVWINGQQVGYSEDGTTPAEFNISEYLKPGENILAVEVTRWSDGSYLDDQDLWRVSGIFRDVYLFATPAVHVRDFSFSTDLDETHTDATAYMNLFLVNYADSNYQAHTVRLTMLSSSGDTLLQDQIAVEEPIPVRQEMVIEASYEVPAPALWSAEQPNLYQLIISLESGQGTTTEAISTNVGFRKVVVEQGQILVNGAPVSVKEANCRDHNVEPGLVRSEASMREEIEFLKQQDVNKVCISHYPDDPRWYDLTDEYGLYVVGEANIERNQLWNEEHSPTQDTAWQGSFVARGVAMAERDKNHPSIVMWSLGHKVGDGPNPQAMADTLRVLDPSRPLDLEIQEK